MTCEIETHIYHKIKLWKTLIPIREIRDFSEFKKKFNLASEVNLFGLDYDFRLLKFTDELDCLGRKKESRKADDSVYLHTRVIEFGLISGKPWLDFSYPKTLVLACQYCSKPEKLHFGRNGLIYRKILYTLAQSPHLPRKTLPLYLLPADLVSVPVLQCTSRFLRSENNTSILVSEKQKTTHKENWIQMPLSSWNPFLDFKFNLLKQCTFIFN